MLGVVPVEDNEAFRDALEAVHTDTPGLTRPGGCSDGDPCGDRCRPASSCTRSTADLSAVME
jgi:hypothetical protein